MEFSHHQIHETQTGVTEFKTKFRIPIEVYRLCAAVAVASIIAAGVVFSRGGNTEVESTLEETKIKFEQPNKQIEYSPVIPVPKREQKAEEVAAEAKDVVAEATVPIPRPRPVTDGFYYAEILTQGDGEGSEFHYKWKPCIRGIDFPEACRKPERNRRAFPVPR